MNLSTTQRYDLPIYSMLYEKYKGYLIPFVIFLACVVLVMQVVLPQYEDLQQTRAKEEALRQKNQVLQGNLVLLKKLPEATLDDNMKLSNAALPSEKDYAGILIGVPNAAAIAKTPIDDFSFTVGQLGPAKIAPAVSQGKVSTEDIINIDLLLKGDEEATKLFLQTITQVFPLAGVNTISLGSSESVTVKTEFYSKGLPKFSAKDEKPLQDLSQAENALLQQLVEWQKPQATPIPLPTVSPTSAATITPSASVSASPTPRL